MLRCPVFLFVLLCCTANAQSGPEPLKGVINRYARVLDLDTCRARLLLDDASSFHLGERILVMQMQGAVIQTANNASFGQVADIGAAGLLEVAWIDSILGDSIWLRYRLWNRYQTGGSLQVVSFPAFDRAVVIDTLRPAPWNGATGGVLAFTVADTLELLAPIFADGRGFRGGPSQVVSANPCSWAVPILLYGIGLGDWRSAPKGEGIARFAAGLEAGRGPQANGGGGGNDHNSGGGGGANVVPGGAGGINDDPNFLNCQGDFPGLGGRAVPTTSQRLFLGGGGGGGHSNNTAMGGGGAGGGIIIVQAGFILGNNQSVASNGLNCPTNGGDGAGGGGAGGTIWLRASGSIGGPVLAARGGRGGQTNGFGGERCFGPGGGGSGGRLLTNLSVAADLSGGAPGTVINSVAACLGSSNGAAAGVEGQVEALFDLPESDRSKDLPTAAFSIQTNGLSAAFNNASQHASGFWWTFGDGSVSTEVQPTHTYAYSDTFLVTLTVWNDCDTAVATRRIGFQPPPTASIVLPDTVFGCLDTALVVFQHAATGSNLAFTWLFPGGTPPVSDAPAPVIGYNSEGLFSALLVVSNAFGSDTTARDFRIVMLQPPEAGFTFSLLPNGTVVFSNASSGAFGYIWDFGDGSMPDTAVNPVHAFTQNGVYTVTLSAYNSCGVAVYQVQIEVDLDVLSTSTLQRSLPLRVYPNPTRGALHVAMDPGCDLIGYTVMDGSIRPLSVEGADASPDLSGLPGGLCWLRLHTSCGLFAVPVVIQP